VDPLLAADWVVDRIADRAREVTAAARALPSDLAALGVPTGSAQQADVVASALVRAQGAHLDWLNECGRYSTGTPVLVPKARSFRHTDESYPSAPMLDT
jgi:hypothetical protein